ncbi:MAG TPA: hypothetical protein VIM69_01980 [Opitutaceae bacterium]
MPDVRKLLAEKLSGGLSGWFQNLAAQNLHSETGEDSARVVAVQILNAQNRYKVEASTLPQNWGVSKRRIDVAIKGRSQDAQGWYGAVELKWITGDSDWHQIRLQIIQDIVRLGFVETSNLCANFLVIGGTRECLYSLFDEAHPHSPEREQRRVLFDRLLYRDINHPTSHLLHTELEHCFLKFEERVPEAVFDGFDGRLKAELLARNVAYIGQTEVGSVCIWQCKRTRGSAGG